MNKDQAKALIQEKIEKANYNVKGTATVTLDGISSDTIQTALEEIKKSSDYSRLSLEYSEESKTVNIVDPYENIEGFENTHPSRKPCK